MQTRTVPVRVPVGTDQWATVPVPASGIEQPGVAGALAEWCVYKNLLRDDTKLCGQLEPDLFLENGGFSTDVPLPSLPSGSSELQACHASLCLERVALCIGYLSKEIASSPLDLELEFSQLGAESEVLLNKTFDLAHYGVSEAELAKLPQSVVVSGAPKLRFSALASAGQAAMYRTSSMAHQFATRIANSLASTQLGSGQTCAQVFADADAANAVAPDPEAPPNPTNLAADEAGRVPTWTDLHVETFLDAAVEYQEAVKGSIAAMRGAAETQALKLSPGDATNALWNDDLNSARAVANYISFGDPDSATPISMPIGADPPSCSGGNTGPERVPVCPPGLTDSAKALVGFMLAIRFEPTPVPNDGAPLFLAAYQLYQSQQGQTPASTVGEAASQLGVGIGDINLANDYLCAETQVFNGVITPNPSGGVFLQPAVTQIGGAVVATGFSGAVGTQLAGDLYSSAYALSAGASRGTDSVKLTAAKVLNGADAAYLDIGLNSAATNVLEGLKVDAGRHRIEWRIGNEIPGTTTIDQLTVNIYGIPAFPPANTIPAERYFLVQGLNALKCVVDGSIDGAPCVASDMWIDLNAVGSFNTPVPADQPDLEGGYLSATVAQVQRAGTLVPITQTQQVYLVRQTGANGGVREAFGGILPVPESGTTRVVWTPAGGSLDEVVRNALTPNVNDCSKVQDTCAGLPVDLWPPLESEINGDPNAAQNYESSWKRYLSMAKDAAAEADRRGEELLQQGLSMDVRREQYKEQLLDLCGADGDGETGCSEGAGAANPLLEDVPWATLGDKPLCAWELDGEFCGVPSGPNGGMPMGFQCPMPLPDTIVLNPASGEEQNNIIKCHDFLAPGNGLGLPQGIDAIPIPYTLKYAKSEFPPPPGVCGAFTALRNGEYTNTDGTVVSLSKNTQRSDYIRKNVANYLSAETAQGVMKRLTYHEEFADHYTLMFDKKPVFKTDRPRRPSLNADALAPCAIRDADIATGSAFWTQSVECYESGKVWPPATEPCEGQPEGYGNDGCLNNPNGGMSLDTEPTALRNRWAFGFGHLRRSVATLGALTGELNERMFVAGVWNRGMQIPGFGVYHTGLHSRHRGSTYNDPLWMQRGRWNGKDRPDDMWCVHLPGGNHGGAGGVGSDALRLMSGRPVNFNGFIANLIPSGNPNLHNSPGSIPEFPWLCAGSDCAAGVDPQMVYCGFPDASVVPLTDRQAYYDQITLEHGVDDNQTSGFVGVSHVSPVAAKFKSAQGDYYDAVQQMWTMPDGDFCADSKSDKLLGAVWRSLCVQIAPDGDLTANRDFMRFGRLPNHGTEYVTAAQLGRWLRVNPSSSPPAEFLYDSRASSSTFQYPLDQRNIFDALELACHAQQYSSSAGVRCEDVSDLTQLPADLDQIASILNCQAGNLDKAVRNYVVPGVPRPLVDAVDSEQGISSTSGLGGQYLTEMSNMHAAFKRVTQGYGAIRDAHAQLGLAVRMLKSINDEGDALDAALVANTLSTMLTAYAQMARDASDSAGVLDFSKAPGKAIAAAATYAAAQAQVAALAFQNAANDEGLQQKRLSTIGNMVSHLASARAGADEVVLSLNALNVASANLRLIRKKADVARSRMEFSDYAGEDDRDPEFVNVVMRRTYNTRLIRYQESLERARRLAFIARRAVELRFGLDLGRMTSDMTLVDAPAGWANKICDLTGIDYSAIRAPDPDGATEKWQAGGPPPEGDDFANQYVGNYVTWLEDFVSSYPFDYPLQDGDDFAVVSLRDDIMGAKGECVIPGGNLLYYSTEFEKQESVSDESSSAGWQVEGCGVGAPVVPGEDESSEWSGCLNRLPAGLSGMALDGLPRGALPYLLSYRGCDAQYEFCPDLPANQYRSEGQLVQYFAPSSGSYHRASLYVKRDVLSASYAGFNALLKVERLLEGGGVEQVAARTFTPDVGWTRVETDGFPVTAGGTYRISVSPSDHPEYPLTNPAPGLFVAAASVEAVARKIDGTDAVAGVWQRTDAARDTVDPVCAEAAPQGMRRNFRYRCNYICRNGIGDNCPADSPEAVPVDCFYEANFNVDLDQIESGELIPSGQLAIGNFNLRHNTLSLNLVGTNVKTCDGVSGSSCFGNGFVEYTLIHSGATKIRNYQGDSLYANMDRAFIEHGKGLATERLITNPPSSADEQQLSNYMKREFKGRPLQGLYTLRIWDRPGLRWENVEDIQLVWKYHYWSRFQK